MTQSWDEVAQLTGNPKYADLRWNVDDNRWEQAKQIIGSTRVTLGPQASQQYLNAPEHLAMVLARYRAAAALIGDAQWVMEIGCGEGIGAGILERGRRKYIGIDVDAEAIAIAKDDDRGLHFEQADTLAPDASWPRRDLEAVVSLDVIEHIPVNREADFMRSITSVLTEGGLCVIGTPNAAFDHLASPQSRAGHVNTYTHERLYALMTRHFRIVQSFGMQDTSIHLGHPGARHYLLMCGIGPR